MKNEHLEIVRRLTQVSNKKYTVTGLVDFVLQAFPEYRSISIDELEAKLVSNLYFSGTTH